MRTAAPLPIEPRAVAHRVRLDALVRAFLRWQTRRALARLHAMSDCRLACLGLDRREIEASLHRMCVQSHSTGAHIRCGESRT